MKNLHFEIRDGVGLLTIDRPKALNALNLELLKELEQFLVEQSVRNEITVLIVTGSGDKAFIAGADIGQMQSLNKQEIDSFIALGQQVTLLLESASFIVIAAVNGYALGGGLEMALACDFIYAADTAKLGLPEVTLGIIPGFGGTQRLARAVGERYALEMIATGKAIGAKEALEKGLVNRVFEPKKLIDACLSTAGTIAGYSKMAITQVKRSVILGRDLPIDAGLELEKSNFNACFDTPEREEAMRTFLARKANA